MVQESSDPAPVVDELVGSAIVAPDADVDPIDEITAGIITSEDVAADLGALELVMGSGVPQRVGRFRFFLHGQRWEWSDAVAGMHGYEPGTVQPTTELLLQHKHPEDRVQVAAVLDLVLRGKPFSSRHRIIDTAGHTHWVVVVGDLMRDDGGAVIGTSGFYVDVTEALQAQITAVVSDYSESRAHIEQAKGVLMAAYGLPAQRAFDILVWRSQETNTKLRDFAAEFLAAISGQAPPAGLTYVDHALLTIPR
jgi:PAS domain S-box-containing protein